MRALMHNKACCQAITFVSLSANHPPWRQEQLKRILLTGCCLSIISLLALNVTMADSGEETSAAELTPHNTARAFIDRCQRELGIAPVDDTFRVRHFGNSAYVATLLADLIAAGEKTGTFASPWVYEGDPKLTPVTGGYTVVTDFFAEPRLLLLTTATNTLRFDAISAAETRIDGPAIRALEVWRKVHWAYFTRELAKLGRTPTQDMPVTVEHFAVVCDSSALGAAQARL